MSGENNDAKWMQEISVHDGRARLHYTFRKNGHSLGASMDPATATTNSLAALRVAISMETLNALSDVLRARADHEVDEIVTEVAERIGVHTYDPG